MAATPGVREFTCNFCRAEIGADCVTASGAPARSLHRERFETRKWFIREGEWVVRLKADDPGLALTAGDELLVQSYPLDAKVTVLRRLRDGFDPECNQYFQSVEFVRLAA